MKKKQVVIKKEQKVSLKKKMSTKFQKGNQAAKKDKDVVKSIRFAIRLSPKVILKWKDEAKRRGLSVAKLIAVSVDKYVEYDKC